MFFDFRPCNPCNSVFCLFIVYLKTKLAHKNCERGRKCTLTILLWSSCTHRGAALDGFWTPIHLHSFNGLMLCDSRSRPDQENPEKIKKGENFPFYCFSPFSSVFSLSRHRSALTLEYSEKITIFHLLVFIRLIFSGGFEIVLVDFFRLSAAHSTWRFAGFFMIQHSIYLVFDNNNNNTQVLAGGGKKVEKLG